LFVNLAGDRGVHEYIAEAISACDQTDRPELYANIVIAGGSTCFAGFEQRLEAELREYVRENVSDSAARQCKVIKFKNRKYSAWQGASQMQGLAGFWDNDEIVSSIVADDDDDDDDDDGDGSGDDDESGSGSGDSMSERDSDGDDDDGSDGQPV
jgi:hypothetical protein